MHPLDKKNLEATLKDRIDNDKCFICGEELKAVLKNNLSKHSENWVEIEHSKYGVVGVHHKHIHG
jgi:hypothetical protein